MNFQQILAGVQGVPASQASFSLFSLCLFLSFCFSGAAFSQSCDTLDVSAYAYQIELPRHDFQAGDTALVNFRVGTSELSLHHAFVCDLQFKLSDHVEPPTLGQIGTGGSWLLDGSGVEIQLSFDTLNRVVRFSGSRIDGSLQCGHGVLFSLALVVSSDDTAPTELVQDLGGGYILIDNIDLMKTSPSLQDGDLLPPDFLFFPNPAQHWLSLDWGDQLPMKVLLVSASGVVFQLPDSALLSGVQLNVSRFDRGKYSLVALFPDGRRVCKSLLLK